MNLSTEAALLAAGFSESPMKESGPRRRDSQKSLKALRLCVFGKFWTIFHFAKDFSTLQFGKFRTLPWEWDFSRARPRRVCCPLPASAEPR